LFGRGCFVCSCECGRGRGVLCFEKVQHSKGSVILELVEGWKGLLEGLELLLLGVESWEVRGVWCCCDRFRRALWCD
jgi:hypothetical protein